MTDSNTLKKIVSTLEAPPPLPVFSQAVITNGFVYVSGNVGSKGDFKIVEGGVQAEIRLAIENMTKILEASGTSLENVVKVNVYLANFDRDFVPMNKVYLEFFGDDVPPARTCVGVADLPLKASDLNLKHMYDAFGSSLCKICGSHVMTAVKQKVFSPEANPPLPVYSQAIVSKGFVFVSGTVGHDHNLKLYEGGIKVETRAALENIKKVLKAAGTTLEGIVKANIFITNFEDFEALNEIYQEYFNPRAMPARTCVQVAALPLKAAVEIECIAVLP